MMVRALVTCASLAVVVTAACHPQEAGLELTVSTGDAVGVDEIVIVLSAPNTSPTEEIGVPEPPAELDAEETVGLIIKRPELIGVDVTVELQGVNAATVVATAEGTVRTENHRTVTLALTLVPLFACGDAQLNPFETCDDGNNAGGDGCAADCSVEPGFVCNGEPSACVRCGDGAIADGIETCDDANNNDGDGCSAQCSIEEGFGCVGAPSTCAAICGDAVIVAAIEACDDGGAAAGDGCSDACAIEPGYACEGAPSVCDTVCGDGLIVASNETCDDSNANAGDGCSDACAIEPGYACEGAPSVCNTVCGDGLIVASNETCDDSNANAGDGCSDACAIENGFACAGAPSVCNTVCGDAIVAGTEACDDGVALNSDTTPDACRTTCTLPRCGDTVTDPINSEQCDDANVDNRDACLTSCRAPSCGDGFINNGEPCDDANVAAGDGCAIDCTIEIGSECGGEPSVCDLAGDFHIVDASGGGDFTTLTAAITAATDGDTIFVRAGTYNASVDVQEDLTIVGAGADSVTIVGSANNAPALRVRGGATVIIQGVAMEHDANNEGGATVEAASTATFVACRFGPTRETGLASLIGTTVTVSRSVVVDNEAGGVDLDGAYSVENSAFLQNGGSAVALRVAGTFRFNTVSGGLTCESATPIDSSIVLGNVGALCDVSSSSTSDPQLEPDEIHLSVGSPAIDDGPAAGCPAVDIDGDARPIGEFCDVGADERP